MKMKMECLKWIMQIVADDAADPYEYVKNCLKTAGAGMVLPKASKYIFEIGLENE